MSRYDHTLALRALHSALGRAPTHREVRAFGNAPADSRKRLELVRAIGWAVFGREPSEGETWYLSGRSGRQLARLAIRGTWRRVHDEPAPDELVDAVVEDLEHDFDLDRRPRPERKARRRMPVERQSQPAAPERVSSSEDAFRRELSRRGPPETDKSATDAVTLPTSTLTSTPAKESTVLP